MALNRLEKLNAVSDEVVRHLVPAFRCFDANQHAHVAISCGRGRGLRQQGRYAPAAITIPRRIWAPCGPQGRGANSAAPSWPSVYWKPVIAAVRGSVLGLEMVRDYHLIIAASGTELQLTETSRSPRGGKAFGAVSLAGRRGLHARQATSEQVPIRLYLIEEFREAALAFKEKRKPAASSDEGTVSVVWIVVNAQSIQT